MKKNITNKLIRKTAGFFLIVFIGCSNAQENKFMSKIDNKDFSTFLDKYAKIDDFPFAYKNLPVSMLSPKKLRIEECVKFLNKNLDSLYYREELYNYDEDSKEFGEKRIKPTMTLLKYFLDDQNVVLINNEFSGMNVSDSILTKLYVVDTKGAIQDDIVIKKEEYENDWLPDNFFVLIDSKHFNIYTYNVFERKQENGKVGESVFVTITEYEISDKAKINLLSMERNIPLKYERYDQPSPEKWPNDDPMRKFIE